MIIRDKKTFALGTVMAVVFVAVLVVMFSPVFGGANAFKAADRLFNSIAKGSSYYIPDIRKECQELGTATVKVTCDLKNATDAERASALLAKAGVTASVADAKVTWEGPLEKPLVAAMDDSDLMFQNKGQVVATKYGYPEREVLVVWWSLLRATAKDLQRQEQFRQASVIEHVLAKGVEVGYNFYGIEARRAAENAAILTGALVFYVLYTLWWGYAILFIFDGLGLQMKKTAKKEV